MFGVWLERKRLPGVVLPLLQVFLGAFKINLELFAHCCLINL